MATIICFCSAKGGSGKTAIAASSASFLADIGKRVLIIDTDSATSGMTLLLLKNIFNNEQRKLVGIYDSDITNIAPNKIKENLFFIPSSSHIKDNNYYRSNEFNIRINKVISENINNFDVIIIDAEAGMERSTFDAISISQKVVIVTEFDPLSASGVERLKIIYSNILPMSQTFILVNKLLPEFSKIQSEYFIAWNHLPPIPFDFEVMRAYARGEIPWRIDNLTSFDRAIIRAVQEILPTYKQEVSNWLEQRSQKNNEPINTAYRNIQSEIEEVTNNLALIRAKIRSHPQIWLSPFVQGLTFVSMTIGSVALVVSILARNVINNDPISDMLLYSGISGILGIGIFLSYKQLKQKSDLILREEKMSIQARALEIQLNSLLQKKSELESLISTENYSQSTESEPPSKG
jgi:MinD-like ATPase involved in chromosome partitioning or flagellar assembly